MSTANWITERQFISVWITRLATFLWTKSSPGSSPTISLAGTLLSEQPIHRNSGDCCYDSFAKKPGYLISIDSAHFLLFKKSFLIESINNFPFANYYIWIYHLRFKFNNKEEKGKQACFKTSYQKDSISDLKMN